MRSNTLKTLVLFTSLAGLVACGAPSEETESDATDDLADESDPGTADDEADDEGPSVQAPKPFESSDIAPPQLGDNGIAQLAPPDPGFDACSGLLVNVDTQTDVTLSGTTTGGADDFKTWCGDSGTATAAPDVVYQLDFAEDCVLDLTLTDSSTVFNPVIELRRTACETEGGGDYCATGDQSVTRLKVPVLANTTYWAVIDGAAADTSGDFNLRVKCTAPACGDAIVSPGEDCDDGNTTDNDGCSSTCHVEATATANTCADLGSAISLSVGSISLPGASASYANAGAGVTDDYIGSCAWETGGLDQVFEIVPTATGTLTVRVGFDGNGVAVCQPPNYDQAGCIDHTLFVRETTCSDGTEIACQQSNAEDLTNSLSIPVVADAHYFVFVDGYNGEYYSSGIYNLELTLQ